MIKNRRVGRRGWMPPNVRDADNLAVIIYFVPFDLASFGFAQDRQGKH